MRRTINLWIVDKDYMNMTISKSYFFGNFLGELLTIHITKKSNYFLMIKLKESCEYFTYVLKPNLGRLFKAIWDSSNQQTLMHLICSI